LAKKKETKDRGFAVAAAKIAAERRCKDITILDLRGKSPVTNYFVIATSTSTRQGRTVADEICEQAKKAGFARFGQAGYEHGRWILLDFVDVVVHIFDDECREYYDLEILWGDAERIDSAEGK
jgi:ribosome-associated protein